MNQNPQPIGDCPSSEGPLPPASPNPTAFAEFVLNRHRLIRTYLAKYLPDMATVDRLAGDVLLEFASRTDFTTVTSEHLLEMARDKALEHLVADVAISQNQPGKRVATMLSRWQIARLEAETNCDQQHLDELSELQGKAESLAPSSAALLDAHYSQGRSPEEMGASTGRDPHAIRQSLLKLRSALCAD